MANRTRSRKSTRPVRGSFDTRLEILEERSVPSTGATLAAAGAGDATRVFAVGPDHGLMRYDGSTWTRIGAPGTIRSIAAVTEVPQFPGAFGAPNPQDAAAFVVTANGALARYSDVAGWRLIGGPGTIQAVAAGRDDRGLADAWVLTTAGDLTQWSESGGWLARPVGARGTILDISAFTNGRVDAVTADHSVFRFTPSVGWQRMAPAHFAAEVDTDMNGNIVALTQDGGLAISQSGSGWMRLGAAGTIRAMSGGTDTFTRPEAFVLTATGVPEEYSATTGWRVIGGSGTVRELAAADQDRLFAVTADGSVDEFSNGSGWISLSGAGLAA